MTQNYRGISSGRSRCISTQSPFSSSAFFPSSSTRICDSLYLAASYFPKFTKSRNRPLALSNRIFIAAYCLVCADRVFFSAYLYNTAAMTAGKLTIINNSKPCIRLFCSNHLLRLGLNRNPSSVSMTAIIKVIPTLSKRRRLRFCSIDFNCPPSRHPASLK